jgi:mono/diheme cytochrome c family protein
VTPSKAIAGERLTISARALPTSSRCTASITRPGAALAKLPARRPAKGTVTWRWALPAATKTGVGTARVTCSSAGTGSGRFTIRALPPGDPVAGKTVFLLNCGGCHTLADAGTTGTSVDLDTTEPSYETTVDRVVNGKGLMPSFKTRLTPQQIADVATYVDGATG